MVNAGVRHGRDAEIQALQAANNVGTTTITSTFLATRGERLVLGKFRFSSQDQRRAAFHADMLGIAEIDADNRIASITVFDLDDIDAAFEELDARYLADEAAAYSRTWSVIADAYKAVNRQELPTTTPDWVNIDHRRGIAFPPGGLKAYLHATWDLFTPGMNIYIETVHRLTILGAVVTRVVKGTSREGFDAEWREIGLSTVEGNSIIRSELFDEADLGTALASFDELDRPPQLEKSATRI